ncbi:MAG: hypothetical protein QG622_3581 [Actinomycetota bacterium]|nr:hypothetical protein [Actinomycetota bacterium]
MNTQASAPSSGPGSTGGPGIPPGESFFSRIRAFGVVRPDEGRWAAGVCAGIARRWALDPLLVRGLFFVTGLVLGIGVGLYGLLWLLLPHTDGRIHAQQAARGIVTSGFAGAVVCLLANFPLGGLWGRSGSFGGLVFLALVGFGLWWMKKGRHSGWGDGGTGGGPDGGASGGWGGGWGGGSPVPGAPTPGGMPQAKTPGGPESETTVGQSGTYPDDEAAAGGTTPMSGGYPSAPFGGTAVVTVPRPVDVRRPLRPLTLATLGMSLLAGGGTIAWNGVTDRLDDPGLVASATALGVIGAGVVIAGLAGRRAGGLAPVAVLLAVLVGGGTAADNTLDGFQRARWTPASGTSIPAKGYQLDNGKAVLDLREAGLATGATAASPRRIPVSVGAGELVVIVPDTTPVRVIGHVGLGGISDRTGATKDDKGGSGLDRTVTLGGTEPSIVVDATVGFGYILVRSQDTSGKERQS